MPTVAMASEFLDAFARLPGRSSGRSGSSPRSSEADPTSTAINYEKIHGVTGRQGPDGADRPEVPGGRSCTPTEGDVYVLVWVDNHDEAMDWAEASGLRGQPASPGRSRSSASRRPSRPSPGRRRRPGEPGLFDAYDDDVLLSFGVPAVLLPAGAGGPAVRGAAGPGGTCPPRPPRRSMWLAEGIPPEEVREAVAGHPAEGRVDTDGPGHGPGAPRHPAPVRHHPVATTTWPRSWTPRWRSGGSSSTRARSGWSASRSTARPGSLGGAGTGKTVVAMHRARHLAREVFTAPSDRILFTTYTANLAQNIEAEPRPASAGRSGSGSRSSTCTPGPSRFLRDQGSEFEIAGPTETRAVLGGGGPRRRATGTSTRLPAPGVGAGGPGQRDRGPRRRVPEGAPDRAGQDAQPAPAGQGLEGLRAATARPCSRRGKTRMAAP